MVDLFISYKREDREAAERLAKAFLLRGFQVWWDVNLLPGSNFGDEINEIIETAKATIVLWSEGAKGSEYVRAEALKSHKLKSLVPTYISKVDDLPVPFNGLHTYDLTGWDGNPLAVELDGLVKAVEIKTGKSSNYVEQDEEQIKTRLKQFDAEADFWKQIVEKKRPTAQDYAVYLRRYGEVGQFSHTAETRRLAALKKSRSVRVRIVAAAVVLGTASLGAFNFDLLSRSATQLLAQNYDCSAEWGRLEQSVSVKDYDRFLERCAQDPNYIVAKARSQLLSTWKNGDLADEKFVSGLLGDVDIYPALERELTAGLSNLRDCAEPDWATKFEAVDVRDVSSLYGFLRQSPPQTYRRTVAERLKVLGAPELPDARMVAREVVAEVLAHPAQLTDFALFRDCVDCPEMVVIPAGTFNMGSRTLFRANPARGDELPQHTVTIARPFAIGRFEVTFDQWDACVKDGFCGPTRDEGFGRGQRPVIYVNWEDVAGTSSEPDNRGFLAWLNTKVPDGVTYRLPSEAEWEYAALPFVTVGSSVHDPSSPSELEICSYANSLDVSVETNVFGSRKSECSDGFGVMTSPVGSFAPNDFGIYDIIGNVFERVSDCYTENYSIENRPDDGTPRLSGDCSKLRVLRGGAYNSAIELNRPQFRYFSQPNVRQNNFGFRVAREVRPVEK